MAHITYHEAPCKSAINRVTGMPFNWSLNPYRGCVHACHYCYARATHAHLGLDAGDDFSQQIFIKTNLPEVVRQELSRKSWRREVVAIGTATDPYQPIETKYQLTHRSLEAFRDLQSPVSIVTKSHLIERDLDLLVEVHEQAGLKIYLTITTLDTDLWKRMEPGTPSPQRRLQALRTLASAGIRAGILMHPIMPGLNDREEAIDAMAAAARQHGAQSFSAAALRLAPLVKEHYLETIAEEWPELQQDYGRLYQGAHASARYRETLQERVEAVQASYGYLHGRRYTEIEPAKPRPATASPPLAAQLPLFV